MSYRPSSYNILVENEKEDNCILVNGQTKALDVMDKDIGKALSPSNNEIEEGMFSSDELELLEQRGYITKLSAEEEKKEFLSYIHKIHAIKLANQISGIMTIIPSYFCNLDCFYCYESTKNDIKIISKEMVDICFEIYEKSLKDRRHAIENKVVSLFGGEPLLLRNKDIVKYIYEKAVKRKMYVTVITNGTEIDQYLDLFDQEICKEIQITLDGDKREHDVRRITKSGGPTFDKIVENINKTLEKGIFVSLRINIDRKNLVSLKNLNQLVVKQGWNKKKNIMVYCSQIYNAGDSDKSNLATPGLVHKYVSAIDNFVIQTEKDAIKKRVERVLMSESEFEFNTGFCSTDYGSSFTFDPHGNVYNCIGKVGKKECVIGNYGKGVFIAKDNFDNNSACNGVLARGHCIEKNCKHMLFCGGGCSDRVGVDKEIFYKSYCPDFKNIFDIVVKEIVNSKNN